MRIAEEGTFRIISGELAMGEFFYVYVLRSATDGHNYVGLAHDLRRRFEEHQTAGAVDTKPAAL